MADNTVRTGSIRREKDGLVLMRAAVCGVLFGKEGRKFLRVVDEINADHANIGRSSEKFALIGR